MYWMTLLAGLALFIAPLTLGLATHLVDARMGILLGIVIFSASLWELAEPGRTRHPAAIICLTGLAAIVASFLLGATGHPRMLGAGAALGTIAAVLGAHGLTRGRASK